MTVRAGIAAFALALLVAPGALATELEWTDLPPLPDTSVRVGAFVAVIDDRLVVAGGGLFEMPDTDGEIEVSATTRAFVLESPAGSWRETTPLPQPLALGVASSAGSFAIFAGGNAGSRSPQSAAVYRVTFEGGDLAYQPLPPMPDPCLVDSGAMLDGTFYLACRLADGAASFPQLDLNSDRPSWKTAPQPPGPARIRPATAAQDGALFLFGGTASSGGSRGPLLRDSYRLDPTRGWTRIADLPTAMANAKALPLGPTHIAVLRGARGIEMYHTVTDTWISLDASALGQSPNAAVKWNDRMVAFGGLRGIPGTHEPIAMARVAAETSEFSRADYIALAAYFAVLVSMGLWFAGRGSSTEEFFLAGRRMPWWATGLSIFGTQLSSISFMAVPAKVYATDWVYFLLQMTIVMVAFPVVFLYLPHFRRVKMTSAYEYLEARFNLPVRMYASLSFVLYQLGRMAIVLFLPAIALSAVTGISVYTCILGMGVLATLYTVIGGIKAVIWTDVVQVFVLYGGALLSLVILLTTLDGGFSGLISEGLKYDKFHMFNWTWDWTTTAVWVVLVGNLFMNLVPYTSDQAVVQRYFTTKDEKTAARSIWTNAVLLVPSTLTLFLLGTGLWAFYRSNPELLNPALPTDSIFPLFIAQQLPAGVAGLLIAAVFAASMSTLDSSLNSVSAALVTDFFVRFRPGASDALRLRLARWLTAGLGALATGTSIALATFDISSLWDTFQGMMGLLGGGLAGLFALGIFFRSANGRGAMTGAMASVLILYLVQQHTDLHFFLYGAVGVLSCVGIGLASSVVWREAVG